MSLKKNDEFYIGYFPKMPSNNAKFLRKIILLGMVCISVIAIILVTLQGSFYPSIFEFGKVRKFSGTINANPYPHLKIERPGENQADEKQSSYYLVAPFKHGADEHVKAFDGEVVNLEGTLIYRDNQTMIEIVPESIKRLGEKLISAREVQELIKQPNGKLESLGELTFEGEIVDSKCYLGVMNPGSGKLHRACAVRCISGGIPPVLMVRDQQGHAAYLLLVDRNGNQVNKQVLGKIAEPVRITGEVLKRDNLLILKMVPDEIESLD